MTEELHEKVKRRIPTGKKALVILFSIYFEDLSVGLGVGWWLQQIVPQLQNSGWNATLKRFRSSVPTRRRPFFRDGS